MRLYINEKEAPTLIRALELLLEREPQSSEAKTLLLRIYDCRERQCKRKIKKNRQVT